MRNTLLFLLSISIFSCLFAQESERVDYMNSQIQAARSAGDLVTAIAILDSIQLKYPEWFEEGCEKVDSISAEVIYRYASLYYHKDKFKEGIPYLQKAIKKHRCVSNTNSRIAKLENTLGIFFSSIKNYQAAEAQYKKAIVIRKELNDFYLSDSYNDLANLFKEIGDYENADNYIQEAISIAKEQKDYYSTGKYALTLSHIKYEIAKYTEALSFADTAFSYFSQFELDEDITEKLADVNMHHGDIFSKQDLPKTAINYYTKAGLSYDLLGEDGSLAILYNNIGRCYKLVPKQEQQAIKYFKQSIDKYQRIYRNNYSFECAAGYNNLADIHAAQGNYQAALEANHLAIKQLLPSYRKSKLYAPISLDTMPIIGLKLEALVILDSLASNYKTLYLQNKKEKDINAAINSFEQAITLVDIMRSEHREEGSMLFWREKTRGLYERAIETAILANEYEKAFIFCEKSKAALLLDALNEVEATNFIPEDLIEKEKSLQQEILELQQSDTLFQVIIDKKEELDQFIKNIEDRYPKYYAYKYDIKTKSIADVQEELLDNNMTLVEYFLTKNKLYAFVIEKSGFRVKTIDCDTLLTNNIQSLVQLLSNKKMIESQSGFSDYIQVAYQLHQQLIEPLELKNKQVIIIPDGELNYIPFESLVSEVREKEIPYLIKDYTISYSYSSTILSKNKNRNNPNNQEILALAPISFHSYANPLTSLNQSETESNHILSLFKGQKVLKEEASKTTFEEKSKNFGVLHISSHASSDESNNKIPWIAFHDTLLYLPEVYNLHLNADMVVLSVCEASKGSFQTGEGIMSIVRGFVYAGIPSALTTMWEVNEGVTVSIMQSFYQYLHAGKSKDDALRQAKLDYIHNVSDSPADWAAYIHVGNTDSLNLKKISNRTYLWYFSSIVMLLIIVFSLLYTFRKKYGLLTS